MTHKLEKQHIKKNRTIRVSDREWESLKLKHKKLKTGLTFSRWMITTLLKK